MIQNTKYLRFLLFIFFILNIGAFLFKIVSAQTHSTNDTRIKIKLLKQLKTNYHHENFGFQNIHKQYKIKKNITIAVIDTGIDPNHPLIKNNLWLPKRKTNAQHYGYDFSKVAKSTYRPYDTHGHGTHIAGIIKGIFPSARLLILKYYNPLASGQDNLRSTIKALRFAIQHNVDIINYSGGGPESSLEEVKLLKLAHQKGILIISAAGNESSDIDRKNTAYYPASYRLPNIISVSAHDQNKNILPSSNFGKKSVDILAPGKRIPSSLPNNRSGYLTGTSQATAFVTGVTAIIKYRFPKLSLRQIKAIINQSAKKSISLKNKCLSGGLLDANAAIRLAAKISSQKPRNLAKVLPIISNSPGQIIYRTSASSN